MTTRSNPPHSDPDRDPGRELAERLAAHASRLDVAGGSITEVMARGRHRMQRRRTAVGVAAVVGLAGGTIATINVLTRPPERSVTGADPSSADETTDSDAPVATPVPSPAVTPLDLVEPTLVWNVVEPGSAEALGMTTFGGSGIVGDGPYLAWSTAPGRTDDYRPTLWTSDDGQHWAVAAEPPPVSPFGLAAFDGRFLAFGTTPSTAGSRTVDAGLAVSADAGDTWRTVELPLDLSSFADDPAVRVISTLPRAIATSGPGVLVAARVSVELDWESLLPADVLKASWYYDGSGLHVSATDPCTDSTVVTTTIVINGLSAGTVAPDTVPTDSADTAATSTTVEPDAPATDAPASTVGPAQTTVRGGPCTDVAVPAQTLTWDELGVDPATVALITSGDRFFLSADGESFEEMAGPVLPAGRTAGETRLVRFNGGFAALMSQWDQGANTSHLRLYSTADGQSWTDLGDAPVMYAESVSAFDDRIVLTSPLSEGTVVSVLDGAGTWTTTNLNGALRPEDGVKANVFAFAAAAGPNGITVAGSIFKDPVAEVGGVETTRDGITVRAHDAGSTYTVLDANSGAELGRIENGSQPSGLVAQRADGEGLDVRLVADGPVVATFTWQELYDMTNSFYTDAEPPQGIVLHSTDGVHWSRQSLDEIAGEPVTNSGARMVGSQVIVAVNRRGTVGGAGVPEQLLLIGTPAS